MSILPAGSSGLQRARPPPQPANTLKPHTKSGGDGQAGHRICGQQSPLPHSELKVLGAPAQTHALILAAP